jgi:hypothetical protein
MMSDAAFFVKDVVSPNGAVSIRMSEEARSDDHETHTATSTLRLHRVGRPTEDLSMAGEPGHQALCDREAAFVARAIHEDLDLARHLRDAVRSLAVCLAADESVRTGLPCASPDGRAEPSRRVQVVRRRGRRARRVPGGRRG